MKAIHLQGIGMVAAIAAKEFQVGDVAVWNYGGLSEIVSIVPKGTKMLTWTTRSEDGRMWTRVVKADRLVAISDESLIPRYAKACNLDVEPLRNHLRRDPLARKQYREWKAAA